ncbi:GIN domain-containing protein [uncultured Sphingomonas sp.]|uniref:GIN domain-containing protein n=1 Tax=uncultured Sphingomonas sp. TaxID=158754 RepID=UPI0035CBAFC4
MIRAAPLLLAFIAVPATAAEKRFAVGSFDRVRVNGPFEVTYAIGSPNARVSGDARAIERVEVRVDGTTLTIRTNRQGGDERPVAARSEPVRVTLSSPSLASASVFAGGRLSATRVRGARVDLSIGGAGIIAVADAVADQVNATVIGTGTVTLAGRAAKARYVMNGAGRIDAGKLDAGDVSVLLDGPGEVAAAARYDAQITNTGLGTVSIAGTPKCNVRARAGGPVACGR